MGQRSLLMQWSRPRWGLLEPLGVPFISSRLGRQGNEEGAIGR